MKAKSEIHTVNIPYYVDLINFCLTLGTNGDLTSHLSWDAQNSAFDIIEF